MVMIKGMVDMSTTRWTSYGSYMLPHRTITSICIFESDTRLFTHKNYPTTPIYDTKEVVESDSTHPPKSVHLLLC